MTLFLNRGIHNQIARRALEGYPLEVCGLVVGKNGKATRHYPMRNAAHSAEAYAFDSGEQVRIWRELEKLGDEPVVLYHSHTSSPAFPSITDIGRNVLPEAHHLIVGLAPGPVVAQVRSFKIRQAVVEEPVRLLPDVLEWRYVAGGRVVHALDRVGDRLSIMAVCGTAPWGAAYWMGTGSQAEYVKAERLPYCKRCLASYDI